MSVMQYVVEFEIARDDADSVRDLYGPFDTMEQAKQYADRIEDSKHIRKRMIREVNQPLAAQLSHIHPNQLTIDDQIDDVHDAVM